MALKAQFSIADREKAKEDYRRHHGETPGGAFMSGVRRIKPLDANFNELATGYDYISTDGKPVTVYDGIITEVDKSVFDHEVAMFEEREKRVNELVKAFLRGGDALTRKYIGPYFDWLKANQPADTTKLKLMLKRDGLPDDDADEIINQIKPRDARPSKINSFSNPTQEYTNCINKLQWILKYTCIVFTGKPGIVAPDIPTYSEVNTINDNDSKADKTKKEVDKKTKLFS